MNLWLLWGKTVKGEDGQTITHPLLCHMVDVAEVTGALWDLSLGAGMRARITDALGCDDATARGTLMFWAALHDLGKASPAFQRGYKPAVPLLEAEGLSFRQEYGGDAGAWHGHISAWALPALLERCDTPRPLARDLARGLGGHHGCWPPPGFDQELNPDHTGDPSWDRARLDLVNALATLYSSASLTGRLQGRAERQALVTLVSGLVSTADWLGSMQSHFPANPTANELTAYAQLAAERAREALSCEQWDRWQAPANAATFQMLFPKYAPRPAQQQVIDLAPGLNGPSLVLIEAPTGSGKTEAALYLADYWAHTLHQRGLYVAMPTTATSDQMHSRVGQMLATRYGPGKIEPLLVHGQARWVSEPREVSGGAAENDSAGPDTAPGAADIDAMSWFLPLKRSLLAPFGVGTVDQALLSVLLTRHFFVRLFGLAGKTVIFDEVHAYDTYMSTLFARLLSWLRAQGCSVILLSATLPMATRRALLKAYGVPEAAQQTDVGYPAATWACGDTSGAIPLSAGPDRVLHLDWLPHGDEHLIAALRERLADGGCAAVLCNTVARAQAVYEALRAAAIVPPEDLTLFHARYPLAWRKDIEDRVVSRYGFGVAPEQRRGIVVATQVIEQSLDLDFDLMVSDLAPIDLLIQRAGRLHRHERKGRPSPVAEPRLLLVTPENAASLPDWGSDAYVYAPYILLRTWLTLKEHTSLALPSETQALIEAVYGDVEPEASGEMADALAKARQQWRNEEHEHTQIAQTQLVLPPRDEDLFEQRNQNYEEDNPEVHHAMRALTRLGDQGVSLVCLHKHDGYLTLEPEGGETVNPDARPNAEQTRALALHTVDVSHRGVVHALLSQPAPTGWRKHSLLRHSRLAVFEDGVCRLTGKSGTYLLLLSREYGLKIAKEE